jgi:hypothetical protein
LPAIEGRGAFGPGQRAEQVVRGRFKSILVTNFCKALFAGLFSKR